MLFNSIVPQVFQNMALDAYSLSNQARKQETQKRLDFYFGEQTERLLEQLDQLFSDPSCMILAHLNITKKIINSLSQCYREPPARTITGSEKDKALYQEIVEQCGLDVKMKQASRFTKLLKTILIKPTWRNNHVDIDLLDGSFVDCITSSTPEVLEKVLITDYGNGQIQDVEYSLWDAETFKRLDWNGNTITETPNPYGVLPFLPVFDYPPTGSTFWLPGGSDLIALQELINLKLVDLAHLLSTQSFGVGYIKGSSGGANLKVDPGSLVELPSDGEIGFVSQKAEISQVVAALDKLIKWACVSQGLSAAAMSTDLSDRMSGAARTVDRLELEELRADDVSLWRSYEKNLFNLMRVVWNTHSTRKLSDSATLSIDFADPQFVSDPVQQSTAWDLQLSMGVISPVDVAMQLNPDLSSREEALIHLLKIQEETKALSTTI